MKILIVEDNKISSKLLQVALESEGFETIQAIDGQEALVTLESQSVDCIISDIMMPNVDGFALLYKVRHDHRFRDIIFIMYSAHAAFHDDEQFAIKMGADKYVQKTGSPKEITQAIHELLDKMNLKNDQSKVEYRTRIAGEYSISSVAETEKNEKSLKRSIADLETEIEKRQDELLQLKHDLLTDYQA